MSTKMGRSPFYTGLWPTACSGRYVVISPFGMLMSSPMLFLAGAQLETLMETMRAEIAAQPPVEGAFTPHNGVYCISKFADGEW